MHSSRMRTGRALTVSRGGGGCLPGRGVPAGGGGACQGGCLPGGGPDQAPPGNLEQAPPPVNRMTDRCKNITLAKTSFRPVINI